MLGWLQWGACRQADRLCGWGQPSVATSGAQQQRGAEHVHTPRHQPLLFFLSWLLTSHSAGVQQHELSWDHTRSMVWYDQPNDLQLTAELRCLTLTAYLCVAAAGEAVPDGEQA